MAYGCSFNFRVSNFEKLENLYNETKPINERNHKTDRNIRPLGSRTQKHARAEKIDDNTYACTFYDTRCVIYHRDGKVEFNHGGWVSQSTKSFMDVCVPWGWGACLIQSMLHVYKLSTMQYYIVGNVPLVIDDINRDDYTVHNAVIPTKRKVNRIESKAKREQFKAFLTFARGFMDVLNMEVPKPENGWWEWDRARRDFMARPDNFSEEKYLDVLATFAHQGYHGKTYTQIHKQIMNEVTVYDRVELPIGSLQKR